MAASLVRLYYAVQWTKEPATISSMFEGMFSRFHRINDSSRTHLLTRYPILYSTLHL